MAGAALLACDPTVAVLLLSHAEKITGAYNDGSRVMFLMTGEHAEWCTPTNVSTGMPDGKITYTHTSEIFNTRRVAARDAGE